MRSLAKIDCPIRGQECYKIVCTTLFADHQSDIHLP